MEQARDRFADAARLDPKNAHARCNLGIALHALGKTPEATVELHKALALDPELTQAHNEMSFIYRDKGETQRAVFHMRKVAKAFYRDGRHRDAGAVIEEAAKLKGGGDGRDWFVLAAVRARLGDEEQAKALYDRAVAWQEQHDPNDADMRAFRAEAERLLKIAKK